MVLAHEPSLTLKAVIVVPAPLTTQTLVPSNTSGFLIPKGALVKLKLYGAPERDIKTVPAVSEYPTTSSFRIPPVQQVRPDHMVQPEHVH